MPRYSVRWSDHATSDLESLGRPEAERVRHAIETRLADDPRRGQPLRGMRRPLWKFRVGDYRVVYVFNDAEVWVLVVRVAHRSRAYRGL